MEKLHEMSSKVDLVGSSPLVFSLEVWSYQHCQEEWAHTTMVCLVKLPTLQEWLKDKNQWPQFRVFFLQKLDEFHTVDSICPVKWNIDIDVSLPILELNQGDFSVFQWLNTLADATLHQSIGYLVDLSNFTHLRIIHQKVDVRHWQIESRRATSKNHDDSVWVAGSYHLFDAFDEGLSCLFLLGRLLDPFDEIQNLRV